ncbi:MAG: DNA repair exonuclease [Infirmifilum sp.]
MVLKIVHTADNHLDPKLGYLGSKVQERRQDFYKSFLRVVEYVLEVKPDILLISGDLFDSINPRNPVRTNVLKAFRRISSEGVRIFLIGGNHDMPRSQEEGMSPLGEVEASGYATFLSDPAVFQVEHLKLEGFDVAVAGLSFDPTLDTNVNPLRARNLRIPIEGDINIAMLHYNFAGFRIPPSWAAPTITPEDIPPGLHYLALGHLHQFTHTTVKGAHVVYPGSTERRSFNEESDEKKGFVHAEIDGSGVVHLKFIETPTRPMKSFELSLDDKIEDPIAHVVSSIPFIDPKAQVRVKLRGSLPLEKIRLYSKAELVKRLENRFFHVTIDDSELKCILREVRISGEISSPLDSYRSYFEEALKNAVGEEAETLRLALELGMAVLQEVGAW